MRPQSGGRQTRRRTATGPQVAPYCRCSAAVCCRSGGTSFPHYLPPKGSTAKRHLLPPKGSTAKATLPTPEGSSANPQLQATSSSNLSYPPKGFSDIRTYEIFADIKNPDAEDNSVKVSIGTARGNM